MALIQHGRATGSSATLEVLLSLLLLNAFQDSMNSFNLKLNLLESWTQNGGESLAEMQWIGSLVCLQGRVPFWSKKKKIPQKKYKETLPEAQRTHGLTT